MDNPQSIGTPDRMDGTGRIQLLGEPMGRVGISVGLIVLVPLAKLLPELSGNNHSYLENQVRL